MIVCPIWPLVAPFHKTTVSLFPAFSHSSIWKLLAGVVLVKLMEEGEICMNVR